MPPATPPAPPNPQGGGMAIRGGDLPDGGVGAGPVRISANPELNGAPSLFFLPRDTASAAPPAHQQQQQQQKAGQAAPAAETYPTVPYTAL